MNNKTQERRRIARVKTELRTNYQIISRAEVLMDPYDRNFAVPRYHIMMSQLKDIDAALNVTLSTADSKENQHISALIQILNQKIGIITESLYDTMIDTLLPSPKGVDISENGLSFYADKPILPGSHLHLSISNTETDIHICATARVVYSEKEELAGYKTGVYFISLYPGDREKLATMADDAHSTSLIEVE